MAEELKKKMSKKTKIIIAILLSLIILTSGALTARVTYLKFFADKTSTSVVTDNLIGEDTDSNQDNLNEDAEEKDEAVETVTSADGIQTNTGEVTTIELHKRNASDNEKFQAENMLPGDSEVKYFAVKVKHHKNVEVCFKTEVTKQTENLANALNIKVARIETGKVLYNGSFADINNEEFFEVFAADGSTETVGTYKIEVWLPTSTGNEYQAANLMADFNWYVSDSDTDGLDAPGTGDTSNILLCLVLVLSSLALMIILLSFRRKEEKNAEQN